MVSKLTGYSSQTPEIRLSLIKASTIIPVTKTNHIISGVKSLLFIEIIFQVYPCNETLKIAAGLTLIRLIRITCKILYSCPYNML